MMLLICFVLVISDSYFDLRLVTRFVILSLDEPMALSCSRQLRRPWLTIPHISEMQRYCARDYTLLHLQPQPVTTGGRRPHGGAAAETPVLEPVSSPLRLGHRRFAEGLFSGSGEGRKHAEPEE